MGSYKCNVGCIWVLTLAVITGIIPRYWELRFESEAALHQPFHQPAPVIEVEEGTIAKNTTLVATLVDYNVPVTMANEIAQLIKPVFDVRSLRTGNLFRLEREDGTLRAFEYKIDDERVLKVEKVEKESDAYAAKIEKLELEVREGTVTADIQSSLWEALSGYPKHEWLTNQLANSIFAWDVDFSTDIQPGDQLRLLVDEYYHEGDFVKYGSIRAAELVNNGRNYRAFLFRDSYYDEKGNAIKRPFLASPLEFNARISSGFARRRMHPILNTVRSHLAVDYAASTGTPVVAVANGTVTTAGWNGGYGRLVQIRHANGLTTGYAHLSRIQSGIRPGVSIKQGERIGAVGATGLATGPHLHYMMTRNGAPINPLSIKSEPPIPLPVDLKAEYFTFIGSTQQKLSSMSVQTAAR
jgi:murein DD-endopeptidase MepM/ murein hydrolase activator NlpD